MKFTKHLKDFFPSLGDNTESNLLPGSACICQSEDGSWYRGEVICAPADNQLEVLLVDTGVSETVSKSKVWPIEETFLSLPRYVYFKMYTSWLIKTLFVK